MHIQFAKDRETFENRYPSELSDVVYDSYELRVAPMGHIVAATCTRGVNKSRKCFQDRAFHARQGRESLLKK